MMQSIAWRRLLAGLAVLILPLSLLSGCTILGAAASALPQPPEPPSYRGMENQRVAVMVWADSGVRTDFPRIQLDTANAIQERLKSNADAKDKEFKGVLWPWEPRSVCRFQQEHPDIDALPITDVAPRLDQVTRLIYVEIQGFSTHSEEAMQLWRGTATMTLRVVEILDGKAKVAYEEHNIVAIFPPKTPPEGVPGGDPYKFYVGTVGESATQISNRLVTHESDEQH